MVTTILRGCIYEKKENEKTFIICTVIKEREKKWNKFTFFFYLNDRRIYLVEQKDGRK